MNRTYCLYRVSTKGQVDKDDIPMQRMACQEFAQRQGWDIVKEFSEKGVSGFKVSSEKRDAIQQIKVDDERDKFDILLVFMFDRIGRRDDETPFVVQWFSDKGIQVWSVSEGEARFDTHVDKLMNYIRFWQASGESIKTSTRTKTRLEQMTREGHWTGGVPPYGYRLIPSGRFNKKGKELMDIEVCEEEAEVVKIMYSKTINEGLGSHRLAMYLNSLGHKTKTGNGWTAVAVHNVLKRKICIGYLVNGEATSQHIPELQIVDEDTYRQAVNIVEQRSNAYAAQKRTVPLNTKGKSLLQGLAYCGHCGSKLIVTTHTRVIANGTENRKITIKYACYKRTRKTGECTGQSVYNADEVDNVVSNLLHDLFVRIKEQPREQAAKVKQTEQLRMLKTKENQLNKEWTGIKKSLENLNDEILKVIEGKSGFTSDVLNNMIQTQQEKLKDIEAKRNKIADEVEEQARTQEDLAKEYAQFHNWAEVFDEAPMETKKMIAAYLIKRVIVKRDYEIEVEFNLTATQFDLGIDTLQTSCKSSR